MSDSENASVRRLRSGAYRVTTPAPRVTYRNATTGHFVTGKSAQQNPGTSSKGGK